MVTIDDILHPEYLEKILEILNREKKNLRPALGAAYRVYRNGGMIAVTGRIKSKFRVRHHKE